MQDQGSVMKLNERVEQVNLEKAEAGNLLAMADAYRLVSIFMVLPGDEVAQGIVDGSVRADLVAILEDIGASGSEKALMLDSLDVSGAISSAQGSRAIKDMLRRDYTALYTDPEHPLIPLYEGIFKGSDDFPTSSLAFVSPTALHAEECYRAFGLGTQGRQGENESADHMAIELEFMSYLYKEMAQARASNDDAAYGRARDALLDFDRQHLLKWGGSFFDRTVQCAATPWYRAIGLLGRGLVAREEVACDPVAHECEAC